MLGSALGHADYVLTRHRLHGRRTRPCARSSPAPASAGQRSHTLVIDRRGAGSRVSTAVGESAPPPTSTPRLVGDNRATSRPSQAGWLEARRSSGRNPASTEARAVRSPEAHGPFTGGLSSCHRRTEFARRNARRRAAGAGSVPRAGVKRARSSARSPAMYASNSRAPGPPRGWRWSRWTTLCAAWQTHPTYISRPTPRGTPRP